MGKEAEADAVMDAALHLPSPEMFPVHQAGMRLLWAGRKEKALEVFKFNAAQHPDEKFYTYVGLARGYTALGDKANAIKNWEIALKNVPAAQKPNQATFEKSLKDLKDGK